ncbi:MAG TPA: patatin-like phospholipase family protein [Candidatus Eremiobacteraceae bacterium]|nr:patatin-like phospholipase family protein [Candidatus Eremiobacteraceae bacterium]
MENRVGLVVTGGGARGAYQAGVLLRLAELKGIAIHGNPFPLIGGSSAGAVNGAALASGCDDFLSAAKALVHLWRNIQPSDIFHCDLLSQVHNSITWMLDLSFGAILGGGNAQSLLDATPLRTFLNRHLNCEQIQANIKRGNLHALAISATNYNSGKSYLFIQGAKGHPVWHRLRLVTVPTKITVDHICASAAIPLLFQPVRLKIPSGEAFFGDGCVRLQQPLSPVIRLGAEKVFAIGVRCDEERLEISEDESSPSLAQVMGVLFNVMFLDHLATDLEHLERLNHLLESGQIRQQDVDECDECEKIRSLSTLFITPSVHLSDLAKQHYKDMPYLIQYFVSSLGRDAASCADVMSYLMFTPKYTRDLIAIGYHDADERIDEVEEFLFSGNGKGYSPGPTAKGAHTGGQKRR